MQRFRRFDWTLVTALLLTAACAKSQPIAGETATPPPLMHPATFGSALHGPAYVNGTYSCKSCHGPELQGGGAAPSCSQCHSFPLDHTGFGAGTCTGCHAGIEAEWVSSVDLHAASAAEVLLNVEHDSNELLVDACLNCHSMRQRVAGMTIDQFVTPVDTTGSPAGVWTLLPGASAWQATGCVVCHDPSSTELGKIAKYGAILDQDPADTYFLASALPVPSQSVFAPATDSYVDTAYLNTTSVAVAAVKLCDTCHDPADQGAPPNAVLNGHDYGPQGGDSRAFVTASHAGMSCIDCHPAHAFAPVDPDTHSACGKRGCHDVSRLGTAPGVVHTNHLP
jgi:hypothetical protein